jgi:DNA-binding MarR family transcriptional regulator
MSRSITLKHPSKADKDESRLVLVSNVGHRWLEPTGLCLSEEVLQNHSRELGPLGLAVYVVREFLIYQGKDATVASIAAHLGCQKVTVKKYLLRLEYLGLIDGEVQ